MDDKKIQLSQEEKAQRIYRTLNDYYILFPDRPVTCLIFLR